LASRLQQGTGGHLLAIASGALVTLSLAPFNLWPAGLLSVALLVWLLHGITPGKAALRGWCYGLGLFGCGTSWVYVSIHTYGHAPAALAAGLTVLFCAGLALFCCLTFYLYARFIRDLPGGHHLGFAALFVLGEWLRSWFLTGFPWLYLGYGHLHTSLSGWAPVGGVLLVSFIIAYSGAFLGHAIQQRKILIPHLIAVCLFWFAGWSLQNIEWTQASNKPALNIAMVQANIGQDVKWDRDQYWPSLNLYNRMSQPLWAEADAVIWPEAAVPAYYDHAQHFLGRMTKKAEEHNSSLILGIPYREKIDNAYQNYNSIMAFAEGSGIYHKQRLVPFGEYVPLENILRGLIGFFDLPMSQFSSGKDQELLSIKSQTLAPFICYEIVYPDLVASWLPQAELLITISNDAWFGDSIGPLQHMQMAQMRALENGRYLIRSTGNGISAIVNPKGHIEARSEQFQQQVLQGKVQAMSGSTPFSITGSWPTIGLCLFIWALLIIRQKRLNPTV
jgi:apolipoprotein N-acyltransferase